MLFNSYEFIFLFLPFSFFIYFYLLNKRLVIGAKGFLVFASLFFYSLWNVLYLPIILSSMLFNYVIGNSLNNNFAKVKIKKSTLLTFGIVSNIALLAYFKYSDFFIENFNLAFDSGIGLLHLALPLAISFFTFQQIAYLVDSYRGETKEYDFLNYALFVTFFPQLIAGPIVHHAEMMPQFASRWNLVKNYKNIAIGLFIFSIGLFKKVVIADYFAIYANNGFDKAEILNLFEAWITSLSYTIQLYFDFSGYTDMAIGIALLFNIKLPINFNSPYRALNIQEFWRRWHITLSRFLREYVYIPLGGNKTSTLHTYSNLMITFVLGGLWHGPSWTFIFWGFLHAFALIIYKIWAKMNFKLHSLIAGFITFNFINISWIFFRAKEWDDAFKVLNGMFFGNIVLPQNFIFSGIDFIEYSNAWLIHIYAEQYLLLNLFLILSILLFTKNSQEHLKSLQLNTFTIILTVTIFMVSILNLKGVHEFLYYNF